MYPADTGTVCHSNKNMRRKKYIKVFYYIRCYTILHNTTILYTILSNCKQQAFVNLLVSTIHIPTTLCGSSSQDVSACSAGLPPLTFPSPLGVLPDMTRNMNIYLLHVSLQPAHAESCLSIIFLIYYASMYIIFYLPMSSTYPLCARVSGD